LLKANQEEISTEELLGRNGRIYKRRILRHDNGTWSVRGSLTLLQEDTRNYIHTEQDVRQPTLYLRQHNDYTRSEASYRKRRIAVDNAMQETVETVLRAVEQEPETSIRVIARESYSTVQRILQEEKMHAYHYTRVQNLQEEDYPRRRFFENFLRKVDEDPEFPSRVIFSDESLFTRKGIVNSHNMHMWSDENPQVTRFRNFQVRWKINVWAEIMNTNILGPIILPEILNGASYKNFLTENIPDFLEEIPKIIFQQDGAGPHNAKVVTDYLNEQFPGRWMGRYSPIPWSARS